MGFTSRLPTDGLELYRALKYVRPRTSVTAIRTHSPRDSSSCRFTRIRAASVGVRAQATAYPAMASRHVPVEPLALETAKPHPTHLECPTTILLLDTLYRAVSHVSGSNVAEARRVAALSPRELVMEFRLPLVTGYQPTTRTHAGGESAPDAQPWTALIAETHAVLARRRRMNGDAADAAMAGRMRTDNAVQAEPL